MNREKFIIQALFHFGAQLSCLVYTPCFHDLSWRCSPLVSPLGPAFCGVPAFCGPDPVHNMKAWNFIFKRLICGYHYQKVLKMWLLSCLGSYFQTHNIFHVYNEVFTYVLNMWLLLACSLYLVKQRKSSICLLDRRKL